MKPSWGMSYQVLLEDIPLMIRSQMYFQHDGAPPHYTRHVREYLYESFPNRWLGRGKPVAWPPRSPDLTPLYCYLWGHTKTLVYETNVESRAALRDRIFAAEEHVRNHSDNVACVVSRNLHRFCGISGVGGRKPDTSCWPSGLVTRDLGLIRWTLRIDIQEFSQL